MQIWQHNIYYTNIIAIKDVIILEKAKGEKELSQSIANRSGSTKIDQVLSLVNLAKKYLWAISNVNLNITEKLELISINKYLRHAKHVEIELDWLYDWMSVLATFMRHLNRVYM